jgi:hypothetical protein
VCVEELDKILNMVTKLNQMMDVMNRRLPTLEALHQQTHQQEKIHATLQQVLLILQRTPITHRPADIITPVQQEPIQLTVPSTPTFRPANIFTFHSKASKVGSLLFITSIIWLSLVTMLSILWLE